MGSKTTGTIAFAGHGLDRADHLRTDPEKLRALQADPSSLLLQMDGLVPELDENDGLIWRDLSDAGPEAELVFLGLKDGNAGFARVPAQGDNEPAFAHRKSWAAISRLSQGELALYGGARSLVDWHARHRFCAKCGGQTKPAKGGWQRNCAEQKCKAEHFPRTDPVAIMLVENDGDLLLGRSSRFPPRSFSALAGFIEPGETIEEGVAREVMEEAGVVLADITYIASQPWPFPSQLMIGCHGFAASRELTIDTTELEDARWFTRDEVADAMTNGKDAASFLAPPSQAIAHHLLKYWLEN